MSTTTPSKTTTGLPAEAPPAPWRAHARGIVWWAPPGPAARDRLRAALGTDVTPLLSVGALLDYDDTPVDAYREVLALVVVRRGAEVFTHVPFIAVDSPASVVGGRANWALPKTLATFDGTPRSGETMSATGPDWAITATPGAFGPALPWLLPPAARLLQADSDGAQFSARPRGRGTARLARVSVETTGADLTDLLPSGRFVGVLAPSFSGYLPAATLQPPVTS